jgi:hypothetical protein
VTREIRRLGTTVARQLPNRLVRLKHALLLSISFALATAATPVAAHNGYSRQYVPPRIIYLEGVIERATIAYPHPEITIRVTPGVVVPDELPELDALAIPDANGKVSPIAPGRYVVQIGAGPH